MLAARVMSRARAVILRRHRLNCRQAPFCRLHEVVDGDVLSRRTNQRAGSGCQAGVAGSKSATSVRPPFLLGAVSYDGEIVDDVVKNLTEKFGSFAGKWTAYAAFGSFLLYLIGYLTLRFQLSTYGLATDLDLFDEIVSLCRLPVPGVPGCFGTKYFDRGPCTWRR